MVTEKNWQITTSSQPFTGCAQYGNNTQVWSFNYSYVAVCNVLFTYPGCVVGSGSYTVNLTLLIQTPTVPVVDNGVNSPFVVCALLPGSTRTATLNPTGNNPTTTTTSLTLATPTADLTDFNYNSFFYPLSGSNGAAGAADGALGLYDNNMTHLITQSAQRPLAQIRFYLTHSALCDVMMSDTTTSTTRGWLWFLRLLGS